MKANKYKCYLIASNNEHVSIKIDDTEIKNSDYQKILRIRTDSILRILWMDLSKESIEK